MNQSISNRGLRITSLRIENFRSIKFLNVDLGETTVFIGPNNAGKTALLDAVRIALTRRWGQRGTGFTEYDVHLAREDSDPKTSPSIVIELRAEESTLGEWADELHQALEDIVQDDPVTGKSSVTLRVTCAWSAAEGCYQPAWMFLNAARQPLVGVSARRVNLERFWQYLPVFYLGALRDAEDEFSSRSQFWGRLLKAMEIPQALEGRVQKVLDLLNKKLLRADPRLGEIAETLSGATRIAARDREGAVDLRMVPLKSWDLLSKAEIILRNEPDWPWLPLERHGQGVQSLTVIFLFQAFVEHLLTELRSGEHGRACARRARNTPASPGGTDALAACQRVARPENHHDAFSLFRSARTLPGSSPGAALREWNRDSLAPAQLFVRGAACIRIGCSRDGSERPSRIRPRSANSYGERFSRRSYLS